ncbi:MAG: hypothetical protein AAFO88_06375 [Pseudomonadota bacterium]
MTLDALTGLPGLAAGFLWSRDWARAFKQLRHGEQVARRLVIAEAGRLIAAGGIALKSASPPAATRSGGPAPGGEVAHRSPGQTPASNPNLRPSPSPSHGPLPAQGSADRGGETALSAIHREAQRSGDQNKYAATHRGAQRSGGQTKTPPPNPIFALFEPLPDPWALLAREAGEGPQRPANPGPRAPIPHATTGLSQRLRALQAVFDDPVPAARRMAAFMLRGRARRASAILPGHPPAYRLRQFLDWPMDVLMQAHEAALRVMNCGWDPPADAGLVCLDAQC